MNRREWLGRCGVLLLAGGALPWFAGRAGASVDLASRRLEQLTRLRQYIKRGRYPVNRDQPDRAPVFFDFNTRVPCAVAHLMAEDVLRLQAKLIAKENNHVQVADVTSGPLMEWIRTSGLTKEECMLTQPTYPWLSPEHPLRRRGEDIRPLPPEDARAITMHLSKVLQFLESESQIRASLAIAESRL